MRTFVIEELLIDTQTELAILPHHANQTSRLDGELESQLFVLNEIVLQAHLFVERDFGFELLVALAVRLVHKVGVETNGGCCRL